MNYVQADYCRVRKYIITRYNISDGEINEILMLPEQMSDLTVSTAITQRCTEKEMC